MGINLLTHERIMKVQLDDEAIYRTYFIYFIGGNYTHDECKRRSKKVCRGNDGGCELQQRSQSRW